MDLITLEDYKTFKGISGYSEDAKITPLITSVSQLVKTYCGRTFLDNYDNAITEFYSITYDTTFIQPRETPIKEVISVSERDSVIGTYVELGAADYYLDTYYDSIFRINNNGTTYKTFTQGPGSVKIVYKAGYEFCPEDLKLAVIDLINYYLKEDWKVSRTIGSATMQSSGPVGKLGNPGSAVFPDHIKRVLDLYRVL